MPQFLFLDNNLTVDLFFQRKLYIDDKETIDLLLRIEGYLLSYINNLKLLKKYNNKYYIVLSKVFNITTNKVTINIKYIKKKNINKYIAIITIL